VSRSLLQGFACCAFIFGIGSGCRGQAKTADRFQGIVEFDERRLGFELGGRVDEIGVIEGDAVAKGQVLARIDDSLERSVVVARGYDADAAKARAALLRAGARSEEIRAMRAELKAAKVREEFLSTTLERHRKLARAGATPSAVVDSDESNFKAARAQRMSISQRLSALRSGARPEEILSSEALASAASAAVTLEKSRLERYELKAPGKGVVLDVLIESGEIVSPGSPVVVLADTKHPYADVFVPQGDLDGIRIGSRATLRVDGSEFELGGAVEFISRRTEFTPRFLFSERERPNLVIRVRVRIEDPEQRLHAGVPAFVAIERSPQ